MQNKWKHFWLTSLSLGLCVGAIWGGNASGKIDNYETIAAEVINTTSSPSITIIPTPSKIAEPIVTPTTTPTSTKFRSEITLDKKTVNVYLGKKELVIAQVEDSKNQYTKKWETLDSSIATVENGIIKGVKIGTTKVVVSYGDSVAYCKVNVLPVPVESVSLNKTSISISGTNTVTLKASVLPADAQNKSVSWYSNNSSIATVDNYGKVLGYSDGTCMVYAVTEDGNYSARCEVKVSGNTVSSVSLDKSKCSLIVGQSQKRIATVYPTSVRQKNVTWYSSNSDIVKVDEKGTITAVKEGSAVITATTVNGRKTAHCAVTVSEIKGTSLTLNKHYETIYFGFPETLKATLLPSNVSNNTLNWSSSDPAVATVDSDGKVTAVSFGTAIITVRNGTLSASCTVSTQGRYGKLYYDDGSFYEGQYGASRRNGDGILTTADGTTIQGTWSNDIMISNKATVTFENGDEFIGCYKNFTKSGNGTYVKNNGTLIKGVWSNDRLLGDAKVNYVNKHFYAGVIKNNRRNGEGTYRFANGDKFVGHWKNDKMNGSGKYIMQDGSYVKGTFKDNKLTGKVIYKPKNGKIQKIRVSSKMKKRIKVPYRTPVMK